MRYRHVADSSSSGRQVDKMKEENVATAFLLGLG